MTTAPMLFTKEEIPQVYRLLSQFGSFHKIYLHTSAEFSYVQAGNLSISANESPKSMGFIGGDFESMRSAISALEKVWEQILKEREATARRNSGWSVSGKLWTHTSGMQVYAEAIPSLPSLITWVRSSEAQRFGRALKDVGFEMDDKGVFSKPEHASIRWIGTQMGEPISILGGVEEVRKTLEVLDKLKWRKGSPPESVGWGVVRKRFSTLKSLPNECIDIGEKSVDQITTSPPLIEALEKLHALVCKV